MDRKVFYDALRPALGALSTTNVAGMELMLDEAERRGMRLSSLAYCFATAWWESGKTMAPVEEGFYLGSKADAFRRKLRYFPYYGRGLVQLTWKENYAKASEVVGQDLVAHPELALDPRISVKVLFDGMERGWFTGRKLIDYIDDADESDDEDLKEYVAARRIVNGTDRATEIGKLTLIFERALRTARYDGATPPPAEQPSQPTSPAVAGGIGALIAAAAAAFLKWIGVL